MENETVENETVENATVSESSGEEAKDEVSIPASETDVQSETVENETVVELSGHTEDEAVVDASFETDKAMKELEKVVDALPEVEERGDVLIGEMNPAEVKRERKNALSAAVKDPVKEQPVDKLATDEEPPVYDPASAKRDRKDALPSANVDPVEEKSEVLAAVTTVRQSRDQYDVESIVADAPDGAVVKCRDGNDVYAVQIAAAKVGKELTASHRPKQNVRMLWRIPGSK